jgi:hypothetical protein
MWSPSAQSTYTQDPVPRNLRNIIDAHQDKKSRPPQNKNDFRPADFQRAQQPDFTVKAPAEHRQVNALGPIQRSQQ